jgi:hypothetical protein
MRFFAIPFATLLALVAFGPTQTMAEGRGGGQGRGHPDGGQQRGEQHGTVSTGTHEEASPIVGRPAEAGTNTQQIAGAHINPQFAVGGAATAADSWRYRSDNGRWWYWTPQNRWMWYGDDGQWMDYRAGAYSDAANAYVVARPILANQLPEANLSGGPIKITNPATNSVTLSYTLDGTAYTIPPGYSQDLREDRAWVIEFSRGANLNPIQYGLQSGLYSFTSTNQGWELYRSELP